MFNHEYTTLSTDFTACFNIFHDILLKIKENPSIKKSKSYIALSLMLQMLEEDIAEMVAKKKKFNEAKIKNDIETVVGKFLVSFKNEIKNAPEAQLKYLETTLGQGLIALDNVKIKQTSKPKTQWRSFFKDIISKILDPIKLLLRTKKEEALETKNKKDKEIFFHATQNAKKTAKTTTLEADIELLREQRKASHHHELDHKIQNKLVELFNLKPKKGIEVLNKPTTTKIDHLNAEIEHLKKQKDITKNQSLQHIIQDKLNAIKTLQDQQTHTIAHFLRLPELDKNLVGEFIGELGATKDKRLAQTELDTLKAYADTFNFTGKDFIAALREFLDKFRLPGEAQKIDRIIEAFANRYYANNQSSRNFEFRNVDAASVLAFSVIMLNTDAHNPNVPKSRKMTLEAFIKNNHQINAGGDFSREMLTTLYKEITKNEIKVKAEALDPNKPTKQRK